MRRHSGGRELAVFFAGYLTYFGVRAVTEGRVDRALDNASALVDVERDVGIAWEGAIQGLVAGSEALKWTVNAIYIYGHWPVLLLAGLLLFRYRREHYYTLRDVCLVTGLLGLLIFALAARPAQAAPSPTTSSQARQVQAPLTLANNSSSSNTPKIGRAHV